MYNLFIEIVMSIISSFISIFIIFNFMDRMFEKTYPGKQKYVIAFLVSWLLFLMVNIRPLGISNIIFTISMILIVGRIFYGVKKSLDILLLLVAFLFLILSELIGQVILTFLLSENIYNVPGNIFEDIITFFCYQIIMLFLSKKQKPSYQNEKWYLIILIPFISLIIMVIVIYLSSGISGKNNYVWAACACILIFIMNIYVFFLFTKISELNFEKEQFLMMKQQTQMQYRYYNELEEKYKSSKQLLHDIKNHLSVLEELYGQNDEALKYEDGLRKEMDLLNIEFQTSSRVLNILLYHKAALARNQNIDFELSCEEIDFDFMLEIDLNTLFSNLFDNAFDECMGNSLENNFLDLRICQINNFVVINMSNSAEKGPLKYNNRYVSQKAGHMGIGLTNIKKIVERYGGNININYKENVFTVQITFSGIKPL